MKNLSKIIIAYRQKYDIANGELAETIGLHPSTITRIEQGRGIDAAGMIKLISWIFAPAEEKPKAEQPQTGSLGVE